MLREKYSTLEPTLIPEGRYLTTSQISELRGVIQKTVLLWIEKDNCLLSKSQD
jgi:hypothetical protein